MPTKGSDNPFPSVLFDEGATPASPPAGHQRLFIASSDNRLKRVNSGGVVTDVDGLANDSVTNAILRDSAAVSVIGRAANSSGDPADIAASANGQVLQRLANVVGFSALNIPKIVIKASDESVTSDTTLQNDNELAVAIGANETWIYEFVLFITGNDVGNFKVAITTPAGATVNNGIDAISLGATGVTGSIIRQVSTSVTPSGFGVYNTTTRIMVRFKGIVANGANAGNIQLQWAQNTSNGTPTTVHAQSHVIAHRVA